MRIFLLVTFSLAIFSFAASLRHVEVDNLPKMNGEVCEASLTLEDENQGQEKCQVPEEIPIEVQDQEIAEKAVDFCLHGTNHQQAYTNALSLLKVEEEMNVPRVMKGMSLAAACIESGFNSNAEGDHKFSKDGKTPKAIGILQLWPVYERAYKVNRRSVESSARGWIKHIQVQVPHIEKNCKTHTTEETWKAAWVTGVRAPKKGGRCKESLSHYTFFKKMKKNLEI